MLNKYFYKLFIAWDIIFRHGFYKRKITKTTLRDARHCSTVKVNNVNELCICRLYSTQLKNKIKLGIKEKFFGRFLLARISQRQVTNSDINAEHVLVRARLCVNDDVRCTCVS